MNTPNIGWLYYKDYLRKYGHPATLFQEVHLMTGELRKEHFKKHFDIKNQVLLEQQFNATNSKQLALVSPNPRLTMKTIYPGLTLGTGYSHETGEMGEFKLGFFFDHATGYPCIPASTVKGCIRAMFPQKERAKVADKVEKYNYLASVIREIPLFPSETITYNELSDYFDEELSEKRIDFIDRLEREIFDGEVPAINEDNSIKKEKGKIIYQNLGIYQRDIFFDGFIVSTDHPEINRSTCENPAPFIADDYITPHQNRKRPELSPFTNPIPLMFLKILPEVNIQFQFDLKDGLISKLEKEELFRQILLDFGIGAKTNVGYGQFDNSISIGKKIEEGIGKTLPENRFPEKAIPFLKKNSSFNGIVTDIAGDYYLISFNVNGLDCIIRKKKNEKLVLLINDPVTVFCSNDFKPDNPNISIKNKN